MEDAQKIYRFGQFEVDAEREELRKSGLALRLSPQPMRLLMLLIRRAGAMVTREEIEHEIWGNGTYVDFEQGINSAIRQIRYHLGDNAEAPRYIRTVPRRGYVFVAAVEPVSIDSEAPPGEAHDAGSARTIRGPLLTAVAATVVVAILAAAAILWRSQRETRTPQPKEFAVAPFRVIGVLPVGVDPRSFAQELRATIGMLPRRSIVLLDEQSARRAQVRIEGMIQRERDGVRVIVSGIDAVSGAQLWSDAYDRPMGKHGSLAIETAHLVAKEIARRFLPAPRHAPVLYTRVSPKAGDLYRRGRIERMRVYPDSTSDHAEKLFEEALREEPGFSEAWSALADLWGERALGGPVVSRPDAVRRVRHYAGRALALQPGNIEAQNALAILAFQHDYDLAAAEEMFRRVVADDPEYVDAHFNLAQTLIARGEADEALTEYYAARELDPVMFDLHAGEGMLYLRARRFEDALARYRDILAVWPHSRPAQWGSLSAYIAQKRWDEAIRIVHEIGELPSPVPGPPATYEDFRRAYRAIESVVMHNYRHDIFDDYSVGVYYAELGESDRAFEALNRAIDARSPAICFLLIDPRLDPIRNDRRFQALMKRTRLAPREG